MDEERPEDAPQFGTSGLRGPAGALTDELVARYAFVYVSLFPHDGTLLIGRDLRASSPRIARAVALGAAAGGVRVVDCGVLPTPALALAAKDAGSLAIMVTGSHIPADRNGLKFFHGAGEIGKDDEAVLAAAAVNSKFVAVTAPVVAAGDALAGYISRYTEFWDADALKGLRVGVWEHSSAAREVLPEVLAALGAEVVAVGRSDEFVPVDTEAVGPDVRKMLSGWVAEHRLDALVSTDGDADRPLVADEGGRVVSGDIIGPVTARALGAEMAVTTVSANTLVERMGSFDAVVRCRIGSPYVIETMGAPGRKNCAKTIGYEPNGGVLLGFAARRRGRCLAPLMTRDAVLPIVAVLAAARDSSVRRLVDELPRRRTATDRLADVPRAVSLALIENLAGGDRSVLPEGIGDLLQIDTTDGVRMTFAGGVIVTVRPSGNAPELRCYVEAECEDRAQAVLEAVLANLRAAVRARR